MYCIYTRNLGLLNAISSTKESGVTLTKHARNNDGAAGEHKGATDKHSLRIQEKSRSDLIL